MVKFFGFVSIEKEKVLVGDCHQSMMLLVNPQSKKIPAVNYILFR